jgi:hypothetical protein
MENCQKENTKQLKNESNEQTSKKNQKENIIQLNPNEIQNNKITKIKISLFKFK